MNEAGKGSKPRPFSVTQEEYATRWDAIFQRDIQKQEEIKSDYQDILSTEDCSIDALEKFVQEQN